MLDGELTPEALASRRNAVAPVNRVTFSVAALYGLSPASIRFPLSEREGVETGQICVTIDPEADPSCNLGVVDFDRGRLTVRYGVQAVFPGLYDLIVAGKYDPGLLNPIRATATDQCTLAADLSGWRAIGCLEFLPGSLWAGAEGG